MEIRPRIEGNIFGEPVQVAEKPPTKREAALIEELEGLKETLDMVLTELIPNIQGDFNPLTQ